MSQLYTEQEAAKYLGAARSWLTRLRKSGMGPRCTMVRRCPVYERSDLDAFRAAGTVPISVTGRNALTLPKLCAEFFSSLTPDQRRVLIERLSVRQAAIFEQLERVGAYKQAMAGLRTPRKKPAGTALAEG